MDELRNKPTVVWLIIAQYCSNQCIEKLRFEVKVDKSQFLLTMKKNNVRYLIRRTQRRMMMNRLVPVSTTTYLKRKMKGRALTMFEGRQQHRLLTIQWTSVLQASKHNSAACTMRWSSINSEAFRGDRYQSWTY